MPRSVAAWFLSKLLHEINYGMVSKMKLRIAFAIWFCAKAPALK